jgi:hypothetical protein
VIHCAFYSVTYFEMNNIPFLIKKLTQKEGDFMMLLAKGLVIALLGINTYPPITFDTEDAQQICIQKYQQLRLNPMKNVFEKIIAQQGQFKTEDFKGYKPVTPRELDRDSRNLTNFFRLPSIVKPIVLLKDEKGFVVYQTLGGDNIILEIHKEKESGLWIINATHSGPGEKLFNMSECIKKYD